MYDKGLENSSKVHVITIKMICDLVHFLKVHLSTICNTLTIKCTKL